jgi:hypothetical protein
MASEERGLRRRHGDAHADYVSRVPLLLPRLVRDPAGEGRNWRLARVLTNREPYHVVVTLMLVGLFLLKGQGGW